MTPCNNSTIIIIIMQEGQASKRLNGGSTKWRPIEAYILPKFHSTISELFTSSNESTAGADASVEVPKLHNIKLLIASFYTHID